MPEPVADRCTRSHEYFFHFTKKPKYYYDLEATAEPLAEGDDIDMTRNMRTVWHFNPKPYAGAHFAAYPKRLIEPIIRSCSSDYGCCADCGTRGFAKLFTSVWTVVKWVADGDPTVNVMAKSSPLKHKSQGRLFLE